MMKTTPTKRTPTTKSDEVPVGRIAGIFGLRGELKCDPSSAGRTLFSAGAQFRVKMATGDLCQLRIAGVRDHKQRLLIRLDGITGAQDAQAFVGATLFAPRNEIALETGEYLDRDLVGCKLYDSEGNDLGIVTGVEHYPGSDMLVVNGKLVPLVGAFIKAVDIDARRIVADLPPGILTED